MALRAIAYQAEHHLEFLTSVASPEDALDKEDLNYTQNCLNINPAIFWLEEQLASNKSI